MIKSNDAAASSNNAALNSKPLASAGGAAKNASSATPGIGRQAARYASIGLAIAIGATGGSFSALGFLQWAELGVTEAAPMPTMVDETRAIWSAVTRLQNDMAVLRSNDESTGTGSSTGQLAAITDRVDRIEKRIGTLQEKEATGSVQGAPATNATSRRQRGGVSGWSVRDVYRNAALIQGSQFGMIEVSPGDNIPGLGRIHSIRQKDGRWVVVTSKGVITSAPR
jgi:hypothetical protein